MQRVTAAPTDLNVEKESSSCSNVKLPEESESLEDKIDRVEKKDETYGSTREDSVIAHTECFKSSNKGFPIVIDAF